MPIIYTRCLMIDFFTRLVLLTFELFCSGNSGKCFQLLTLGG